MTQIEVFEVSDELPLEDALSRPEIQGATIPERVIEEVLKLGFKALRENLGLIDDIFFKLPKTTRDTIKDYYESHVVTVRQDFPVDSFTFPLVSVVAESDVENVQNDYLAGFEGATFDTSNTGRIQIIGHALKTTTVIYCTDTKDANAASWLYGLVKAILMVNVMTLEAHGLQNVLHTGRAIQLRDDLLGSRAFTRQLTLSYDTYFGVRVTERVAARLNVRTFTENLEDGTKQQLEEP